MASIRKFREFINESSSRDPWAPFKEWIQQESNTLIKLTDVIDPDAGYFTKDREMIKWIKSALDDRPTRLSKLGLSNDTNIVCIMNEHTGPWITKPTGVITLIEKIFPELFTHWGAIDNDRIKVLANIDYSEKDDSFGYFAAELFEHEGVKIVMLSTYEQIWLFANLTDLR